MDSKSPPPWHWIDHSCHARRESLAASTLPFKRLLAYRLAISDFAITAPPLTNQIDINDPPRSFLEPYQSLIVGSVAVFFFLLSMALLLIVLLTKGRDKQKLFLKQRQLIEDINANLPAVVYQFFINADGTYGVNYVNQKAADILELDVPLTTLFAEFNACVHPDDKARFFESIENAGKNMTPWHFEGRFIKPSGSQMWFAGDASPHQDGGQILFNGVIMDITARKLTEERLRTSEQLMSQIINFLPEPTFVVDSQSKVIAWNRAMEALTEVKAESMVGKGNYEYALPFYGIRRPITIDLVRAWDEKIANYYNIIERKGKIVVSETKDHYPLLNKGHFRNVAGPLYDDSGNLIGAIEIIHDITSRHQALDDLRQREELLSFFVTYTPVAVAMFDLEMNYLHYSQRWITDFNLPDEDLTGRCHYDVLAPIPEHWKQEHLRCLQGESIRKDEEALTRPDGSVEWVRRTLYPWRTHNEKIGGIIVLVELTTERKRAEQAAKEAEANLKLMERVVENSPVVLFRWETKVGWPVAYVSGNVKQFGYSPSELLSGRVNYESMIHPDDRMRVAQEVERHTTAGDTHFQQEYRIITKTGEIRWVDDRSVIERDSEGRSSHYQGVVLDISERKNAQEEITKRQLFLESVLYQAPDAIITLDNRHRVIDWNPGAETIFGYTREESISKKLSDLVASEDDRDQVDKTSRSPWPAIP